VRPIVTDEAVARVAAAAAPSLTVVAAPAGRRGRRVAPPAADAAVAAVDAAGPGAIALAPAGSPLGPVARLMGADVVALPRDAAAAAWVVGVALRAGGNDDDGLLRRLEGLASAAAAGGASLARTRPAVLLRWAGWAWRRCGSCRGGGVPGGPCGRCGARVDGGAP
jgi:hypothetical protein